MRLVLIHLALMFGLPAMAADHEASFELGNLHNGDDAYNVFSERAGMPSVGGRVGLALTERLAARAGWHHVAQGADVFIGEEEAHLASAFTAEEVTLGVRADVSLGDFLLPYVAIDGLALLAKARLDDDPSDENSPGQVQERAFAPGALAMGGLEVRIPKENAPFTVAFQIEAGYALVGELDLGNLGTMKPGGFAIRSGLGLRF
jgi:hypothetical protein